MTYKNVKMVDADRERTVTLTVDEDHVSHTESENVSFDYLCIPQIIDLNLSTLNNSFSKASIDSLMQTCKEQGIQHFMLNPHGSNPINNTVTLESAKSYAGACEMVSLSACALIDEERLSNIATLIEQGVKAISITSDMNSNLMRRVMQYIQMKDILIVCTLQDSILDADTVMNESETCTQLGLVGSSTLSEVVQIAKVIEMTRYFGVKVLVNGISTASTLNRIADAKKEGVNVYAQVALHHLILDDTACNNYNTYAKVSPPLRSNREMLLLQEALKEGKIDVLTSAHAPKTPEYKESAFALASDGSSSLDNLFALYYTTLVESGLIPLNELLSLCAFTPAKLLEVSYEKMMLVKRTKTKITCETSIFKDQVISMDLERVL